MADGTERAAEMAKRIAEKVAKANGPYSSLGILDEQLTNKSPYEQ